MFFLLNNFNRNQSMCDCLSTKKKRQCRVEPNMSFSEGKFTNQDNSFLQEQDAKHSEIWELDFFSRPVTDENGKKIWELIIVDSNQTFEHIETIPNNLINSKELKKRIKKVIESREKPNLIKFFRAQMSNMISIALLDLDVKIQPSRRTFALFQKIKQREEYVYPKMKTYNFSMKENYEKQILETSPEKMPDKLKGETYAFALIEKNKVINIFQKYKNTKCFQSFPFFDYMKKKIPGIIIYSTRAKSLASWFDSLEICDLSCDMKKKNITIDCGLNTRYLFSTFTEEESKEASCFEKTKAISNGIHFISIQDISGGENVIGFWLLNSQYQ